MSRRLACTVAYDGTDFQGWQVQPGARTVQSEIEQAFACLEPEGPRIHGSGRTDAGVHARAAVGSSSLPMNVSVEIEGIFDIR